MKRRTDIGRTIAKLLLLLLAVLLLPGCDRREMYVYGDEYRSVVLDVDWRSYSDSDPDGMTVWFYPLDRPDHAPYRTVTASVRHAELYLPGGSYDGVVIDYSPEEYSRQTFHGLDSVSTARVEAVPLAYQPDSLTVEGEGVPKDLSGLVNLQLYGEEAWTSLQQPRPSLQPSELYTVVCQPEPMALDTLKGKQVDTGLYGDYIPWKERDTYQESITLTQLFAEPQSIIWTFHVRIFIKKGVAYLWQPHASLSGLSDGHYLALDENTDRPCLIAIDQWDVRRYSDDSGYISATITTFGLRPSDLQRESLRLNLSLVLRDHASVFHYHFDVGDQVVTIDDQLQLFLDLDTDIELPFVDAYNGTGFGADVTPWDDQEPVDVHF